MVSFHQTKTDRCEHHPTQNTTNPLLLSASIGTTRPLCRSIPSKEFIYGKRLASDDYGAKECFTWQVSKPSISTKHDVSDFQRVNRNCVVKGCITPKDYVMARNNGAEVTLADSKTQIRNKLHSQEVASRPSKDAVYGIKSGNYMPMNNIIQHDYYTAAGDEANEAYAYYEAVKEAESSPIKIKFTKAAIGHGVGAWTQHEEIQPFKLSKFNKCSKKVDTFRH